VEKVVAAVAVVAEEVAAVADIITTIIQDKT
jgi:hypothetical protein